MKPISLWFPWLHSIPVFFPLNGHHFSVTFTGSCLPCDLSCYPQLRLRLFSSLSGPMTLNDICMPGAPNSFLCLWLLHQPPDFCPTWHLYLHFVTNPWGFVLVHWMCSHHRLCCCHKGLKQPFHPSHQVRIYIHNTMFALHVIRWLVFTLQIWTKVILAQWNFPNSRSWGQDSCPPGYSQKFGITCLFTLICLFPQHIPPLELPSWELEHHYMLSQHHHTEGFNNSAFKIIISYEWDRRGSNSWEWMNNWRNKLTNEKQRFSVVQRIEVVWFDE